MRAHQNTWGRVSQAQKMGYRKYIVVCAWLGKGDRRGDASRCTGKLAQLYCTYVEVFSA